MDHQRQNKESCPTTVTRPGSTLQSFFCPLLSLKCTKIAKFWRKWKRRWGRWGHWFVAMFALFAFICRVWPCQVAAALASPQGLASEADKIKHEPCKLRAEWAECARRKLCDKELPDVNISASSNEQVGLQLTNSKHETSVHSSAFRCTWRTSYQFAIVITASCVMAQRKTALMQLYSWHQGPHKLLRMKAWFIQQRVGRSFALHVLNCCKCLELQVFV